MIRMMPMLLLLSCTDDEPFHAVGALPEEQRAAAGRGGAKGRSLLDQAAGAPASTMPGAAEGFGGVDGLIGGLRDRKPEVEKDDEAPAPARSWFPESFLWAPAVEIGPTGIATVDIAVPDSLTTWRVLGLGFSPGGAQAGATLEVLSTLPAYVEVVVPGSLYTGDVLSLPVQVVNTTVGALSERLDVRITGAGGSGSGSLSVSAGGTSARAVQLVADHAGTATILASFGAIDSVERTLAVRPYGRPLDRRGSGAVGGGVSAVPAGAPGPDGELVVRVWSGAESVIREELNGGGAVPLFDDTILPRWPLAGSVYDFALAQAATGLDPADVDPDVVRSMRIRAWQPLARAGRAPSTSDACLLAEGLRGAPTGTAEGLLLDRMVDNVRAAQAPDGSWTNGAATVDGSLLQTAACALAAGDDAGVRLRTEGFFVRNRPRLDDPTLAAWALASGAITEAELRGVLQATVKAALVRDQNGAHLDPAGNLRPDGVPIGVAEATAAAALAMHDDKELASALATGLLALRRPGGGWGDGFTNLMVLRALGEVFGGDAAIATDVQLLIDGVVLDTGSLVATGHAPVTLRARWSGNAARIEVAATRPSPGLVYSWHARSYAPWGPAEVGAAEVTVVPPKNARVGVVANLGVNIATPSTASATVAIGLPAGVRPDPAGMDALVGQGAFANWRAAEGSVVLENVAHGGWSGPLPVVPALAGRLASGPTRLYIDSAGAALAPPARWSITGP